MTEPAPHLLYVAWGFPPSRGGGVYRALATANAFARAGWRVTVLTADRDSFERFTGTDPSLEREVDPEVRVVRIPFRWPAQESDVARYGLLRTHLPGAWRRVRARLDQVAFPEVGYGPWRRPLEAAAAAVHAADPVDLCLATANPNVTFAAARALHRRHGVPYVMDFRDAWLLDVFSGATTSGPRSRAARWQDDLVARAREVWFVNEPIRAWHAARYPAHADRMHVVANGWDGSLLGASGAGTARPVGADEGLVFGYIGTLSTKVPLAELLAGWRAHRERRPHDRLVLRGYLGFYSTPRRDLLDQVDAAAADGVEYGGPVPKAGIAGAYAGMDVLVLALGAGRYVTSGKVFEYLATAKPVVSVHDPANAASEVLRGYPLWFPVADLRPASVTAALGAGAAAALEADATLRDGARAYAEQFERDRQLGPRIAALSAATPATPVTPVTR